MKRNTKAAKMYRAQIKNQSLEQYTEKAKRKKDLGVECIPDEYEESEYERRVRLG